MRYSKYIFILVCFFLSSCATASSIVSKQYPSVSVESIQIFFEPPSQTYEIIALVSSYGRGAGSFARNQKNALKKLKEEAAKIGAHGLIFRTMANSSTAGYISPMSEGGGMFLAGDAGDAKLSAQAIRFIKNN